MQPYAVCRSYKLKTAAHLSNLVRHGARTAPTPNANPASRAANRVWEDASSDPWNTVNSRIAMAGVKIQSVRKDAVRAVHLHLSASGEYFRPTDPTAYGTYEQDRLDAWVSTTRSWLVQRYRDRLVDCRLHVDEATPHIQALYVPLTPDGRLSAKEVMSRTSLIALQDDYGNALTPL